MPPLVTDFSTVRTETGYGLDAGSDVASRPVGPGLTVLTGASGFGKTHLAAAFITRLARSGASDVQVWINASSKWAVMASYAQAACDLGVSHHGAKIDAGVARFLDWLDQTDNRWTVVYDNVGDFSDIVDLLPITMTGQVIITCRQPIHPSDMAKLAGMATLSGIEPHVWHVAQFSPREAQNYLAARLQHEAHDRGQAVDLAADLGHVPLALNLASSTIVGANLDCREYRNSLARRGYELAEVMAIRSVPPVAAAASLAIDLADRRDPVGLARGLLAFMALLDGDGIPAVVPMSRAACAFLGSYVNAQVDSRNVWAAALNLAQSGLVIIDQSADAPLISVHADVQVLVRRIAPAALLTSAARAAAEAMLEVLPHLPADPLEAVSRCVAGLCQTELPWIPEPHPVVFMTGDGLAAAGQAGPAIGYWQSVLESSSRALGPGHAQTLAIRDALAGACHAAGRVEDAIALALSSLAEREQIQGSGHPDAVGVRAALATYYRAAGRLDLAIQAGERVIADLAMGADTRATLAARSQLAATCRLAGRFSQAVTLYEHNVAEWTRWKGPDDSDVLSECLSLGRAYQSAGNQEDAIAVFRKVLASREQALGRGHEDTLAAYACLASAYQGAGRTKDAINCYRQVLTGRQATLGPGHPDTLTALANLASCYHTAHKLKDAIPLYEHLLAERERVQGPDHPDTLTARGNLAGVYHSAGRLASALPLYERTVADLERVLGRGHRDTLTARSNLAHAYHMARRRTEALHEFQRVLADSEQALGPDDALTKAIRENYDVASQLCERARIRLKDPRPCAKVAKLHKRPRYWSPRADNSPNLSNSPMRTPPRKARHSSGVNRSTRSCGALLSRTPT
jgi:tetratricopeptide (TPR) repeat protein